MTPFDPDGSWCLFRSPVEGSRQRKIIVIVLVKQRDLSDRKTARSYPLKRYRSIKAADAQGWRHTKIRLDPENRASYQSSCAIEIRARCA